MERHLTNSVNPSKDRGPLWQKVYLYLSGEPKVLNEILISDFLPLTPNSLVLQVKHSIKHLNYFLSKKISHSLTCNAVQMHCIISTLDERGRPEIRSRVHQNGGNWKKKLTIGDFVFIFFLDLEKLGASTQNVSQLIGRNLAAASSTLGSTFKLI